MRTSLAIATMLGVLALNTTAEAAQKSRRTTGPMYYYTAPAPPPYARERAVCEERAQAADPTGLFAGYPCWAREAFSRGRIGGHGR
jgi:hypothetical protein